MTVILVIFVTALVRCRQTPRHKVVQKGKQSGEWVSPNQENRQIKKKKKKKKRSPKSLLLNFVSIEESKPDDPSQEHINGTLDLPVELDEQTMGKYNWATTPTTFKPDSPDLAKHYKSASPQPTFQIKPETPMAPNKHHVIQELPLDNTFVVGCDSHSKCSSTSSDPYSVSECSCQGGFKTSGQIHTRQVIHNLFSKATYCFHSHSPYHCPFVDKMEGDGWQREGAGRMNHTKSHMCINVISIEY